MIYLTKRHVSERFDERIAEFKPEELQQLTQDIIVFDYEVFPDDVLLITYNLMTGEHEFIWTPYAISEWVVKNFIKSPNTIMVGFNNKGYDNRIQDTIMSGTTERHLKVVSDAIVNEEDLGPWRSGHRNFKPSWTKRTFDIGFDIGQRTVGDPPNERRIPEVSLKKWQRLNGYTVRRCTVPFTTPKLTDAQKMEVEDYGLYDVLSTAMLLMSNGAWDPCFNARRVLVDDYEHLGVDWEMTKPNITAIVLNAKKGNFDVPDNWMDNKFVPPNNLRIWRNRDILQKYLTSTIGELYEVSSKDGGGGVHLGDVLGIPHKYGVGGVHGCGDGRWYVCGDGVYALDAASLYPNLMRHYDLLSRQVLPQDRAAFGEMIDLRNNVYKPNGDRRADGLKLVLNGGFGSMGFEKSNMYDPEYLANVTILGQLLITDLMEKLAHRVELIQSNTDGIFFRIKDYGPEALRDCEEIVKAYEKRTHLEMEWTKFEKIYQRDISTYVAKTSKGKVITKGGWYGTKHCTVEPYLIENRVYSALNEGKQMPVDGLHIMRFAVEVKRDKNSECFVVDGEKVYDEWLDVVPVAPFCDNVQEIYVLTKDGTKRKATNCPDHPALVKNVKVEHIDTSAFYEPFVVDVGIGEGAEKFGESVGKNVKRNSTHVFDFGTLDL